MDEQAAREAQAELQAEAKALFIPLKKWYNDAAQESLKKEHGDFPMFSRDATSWTPFRIVLKVYKNSLREDENKEREATKKKRRSRWGNAPKATTDQNGSNDTSADGATKTNGSEEGPEVKKKRRSRWGNESSTALTSTQGSLQSLHQQKTFLLRLQIDEINRKLLTVVYDAKMAENNPDRSPSPEPIYDNKGKRMNTREVRMRQNLEKRKQGLLEELVKLNPSLKPANMKMSGLIKKIPIPAKDYPGYNFIGLIIGPRGNTQKRMEKETNTKISIRGKGSVKQGRRARDGRPQEDSNEELHVHVQAQDEDGLERATEMIKELLTPVDDQTNEHKQKQLRELAMINGTLREDHYCTNCGQPGHRQWECPNEAPRSFKMADVKCAICGDKSHPTSDCPKKNQNQAKEENALDADYYEFMEMVGGEKAAPTPKPVTPIVSTTTIQTAAVTSSAPSSTAIDNQAKSSPSTNVTPNVTQQQPSSSTIPTASLAPIQQTYPTNVAPAMPQQQQYPPPVQQQYYNQQQQYYPLPSAGGYYYPPQQQQWNMHQQPWAMQQPQWNAQQPIAMPLQPPQPPIPPQQPQPPQPPQPPEPPK
mmetsp:Transcript_22971/g.29338  ORF Transcript_22971/g.29338 Transcript_22971/m.29338 type:complete len:591 (+) Transcript_22971:158-1930(+)|eukprot:CAMPEP_0204869746 /NCGR_PEP_ID=MMETSP1348-20121228/30671_1 /ASSEMBLY_ACC=CAM_ASM_000700 /TAXON_ID=215587 /ORGANISM="Aplanochytrium stocchinoi, Strain GSBS06" /LENGTH=590 /DNA_ID=CAMNT_0052023243 /DNA_START=85 /DNA_END=1857 /DNA_ORIENTATION=-